jgi:hypothetical protein
VGGGLNTEEASAGGSVVWVAATVSGLTPTLAPAGAEESELEPAAVRALVEGHLRSAAPAWDPFLITR